MTEPMVSFAGGQDRGAGGRRRNRSNYRCSKCGQPKRGHVCPYQPRIIRNEASGEAPPETRTIGCQVEIDSRLVVRHLQLEKQGMPESYGEAPNQHQPLVPETRGSATAEPPPGVVLANDVPVLGVPEPSPMAFT